MNLLNKQKRLGTLKSKNAPKELWSRALANNTPVDKAFSCQSRIIGLERQSGQGKGLPAF
jgi:hypothetical protein